MFSIYVLRNACYYHQDSSISFHSSRAERLDFVSGWFGPTYLLSKLKAMLHQGYGISMTILVLSKAKLFMLVSVSGCASPSSLSRPHHLHLQRLGLLPSALIPVRRCQVGHAG